MSEPAPCHECQAFLEEIRRAQRESRLSPKLREELQAFHDAVQRMLAGTGQGVDELLTKYPFRSQRLEPVRPPKALYPELGGNPGIRDAVHKMLEHEARTGHKLIDLLRRK
jgi:hypothetical protein